jgi:hypothetical protein
VVVRVTWCMCFLTSLTAYLLRRMPWSANVVSHPLAAHCSVSVWVGSELMHSEMSGSAAD